MRTVQLTNVGGVLEGADLLTIRAVRVDTLHDNDAVPTTFNFSVSLTSTTDGNNINVRENIKLDLKLGATANDIENLQTIETIFNAIRVKLDARLNISMTWATAPFVLYTPA